MDPTNSVSRKREAEPEKQSNETMKTYDASTLTPQYFALPEATMYYIIKNVTNAAVYSKLIKSCKWFYLKHPIIVLKHCGHAQFLQILEKTNGTKKKMITWSDIKHKPKLWITDSFVLHETVPLIKEMPIYECDAKVVDIANQTYQFFQFKILVKCAETITLRSVSVTNESNAFVSLDELIGACPLAKDFQFCCNDAASAIKDGTVQKMLELKQFQALKIFHISNAPERFCLHTFFQFMKVC
uniref:DUF38 domain-containing protein n=1 Tax=Panagrolaimus superbus TaxID=310955 RepID=A0A914Z1F4_9BILA